MTAWCWRRGSKLVQPQGLPGAERLFDIDTLDGARRLTDHLRDREAYSAVVVGAGFVGLEAATALAARGQAADRVYIELPFFPRAEEKDAA